LSLFIGMVQMTQALNKGIRLIACGNLAFRIDDAVAVG